MNLKIRIIIGLIWFVLIYPAGFAGWIITEKIYHSDLKEEELQVVYFENNCIKQVEEDLATIFDLDQNTIIFLKPDLKIYWKGSIDEYKNALKLFLEGVLKEQLKSTPEDQKESTQKMFENMIRLIENPDEIVYDPVDIFIKPTRDNKKVFKYNTDKYQVWINGILKEELWVSEDVNVFEKFDLYKFHNFIDQIGIAVFDDLNYQSSNQYISLLKKGYPMLVKEFEIGYHTIIEVVNIEKKDLPASEFLPPASFNEVPLFKLGIFDQENNNQF
jgi:hypothetical protein